MSEYTGDTDQLSKATNKQHVQLPDGLVEEDCTDYAIQVSCIFLKNKSNTRGNTQLRTGKISVQMCLHNVYEPVQGMA